VNVDVRRLAPAEVARLQTAMPSWNAHEYDDRVAYQARGLAVQLVAWSDEQALGRGMLVLPGHPEWSASAFRETCPEIRDLAVVPTAQRQGVGSALIAALEREAIEAGFDRIGLMVGLDEDYAAARAVYERRGYQLAHGPFVSAGRLATDDGAGLTVGGVCEYRVKSL
jgi:GNAT superfamily N-acetyltransferase